MDATVAVQAKIVEGRKAPTTYPTERAANAAHYRMLGEPMVCVACGKAGAIYYPDLFVPNGPIPHFCDACKSERRKRGRPT